MRQYVCLHGHFYQPPRESPWTGMIEPQRDAAPYHNWNERITDECYAPNAAAHILDDEGGVAREVNNYSRISYNVGPTLLAWLERQQPALYDSIIAADRESAASFGGHGGAIAQAWGHMILPLANLRDKRTQIVWGLRDFRRRFGRRAEGMWLPETAVDSPTLELLAEYDVRFTILAPKQAKQTREIGADAWRDVQDGSIDTTQAYQVNLDSGSQLAVFFYDGELSHAVAFDRLLDDGQIFAKRLLERFDHADDGPRLVHIATDGETYGHHHRHGEMALAYALDMIEADPNTRLTTYGEFLQTCPPTQEVLILENSSWSCEHGVERWRSDCGCQAGLHPQWSQQWREPLREALDWLRDELAAVYERSAAPLLVDPWAARDACIDITLDASATSLDRFFDEFGAPSLNERGRADAMRLLEMQRCAMLMFTSCGWFFDDLARIETVQILRYSARAIQLAQNGGVTGLEAAFLDRLENAVSNDPEEGDGRRIWERRVRPLMERQSASRPGVAAKL